MSETDENNDLSAYRDYAISANLYSAGLQCDELDKNQLAMISHSYVLTGNVEVQCLSNYNTISSSYQYKIEKPYAFDDQRPLGGWGKYFDDILDGIEENIKRRNDTAIPLDFADVMIVIASLSSLIKLAERDLTILPKDNAEYQGLTGDKDAVSKKAALLERDSVLFRWFVCAYLLKNESMKDDVARALYKAVRCSLVHSLTLGGSFRKGYGKYEITIGSANPDVKSGSWWMAKTVKQNTYTFYIKELLLNLKTLVKDLFDVANTDSDIQRFQSDAGKILTGKTPLVFLKATLKNPKR